MQGKRIIKTQYGKNNEHHYWHNIGEQGRTPSTSTVLVSESWNMEQEELEKPFEIKSVPGV